MQFLNNLSIKGLSNRMPGCLSIAAPLKHRGGLHSMMGADCLEGNISIVESHRSNNMTGNGFAKAPALSGSSPFYLESR